MRHVGVKRLASLLGVVFLLWGGIFAWLAGREPVERSSQPARVSPSRGTELFERHCASCHDLAEMRTAAGTTADTARRGELERFLEGHSAATADENRQILDYLTAAPVPATGSF
jgi:mono/diheme cytochrome c family protein